MAEHQQEDFKEMELWEHLSELRARLVRSFIWLLLGAALGWVLYPLLWTLFFSPLEPLLKKYGGRVIFTNFTGPFVLQLQVSLIAGIAMALPFVTIEVWGFVSPGLTRSEKAVCRIIFPLSVVFFLLGIVTGFIIMGPSVAWFLGFLPANEGAQLLQDPTQYMTFLAKMVLAFGICFQLPLVLMALSYIGLVSSRALVEHWRMALVGCFILGAVATPGGDPFSMVLMSLPLGVLYIASIFLCRLVERFKSAQERKERQAEG